MPHVLLFFPLRPLLCLPELLCPSNGDFLPDSGTMIAAALRRSCIHMQRSQMLITELQPLDQICVILGMGYVIFFMDINFGLVFAVGFGGIAPTRLKYESTHRLSITAFRGIICTSRIREVSLRRFLG
ncbi:hypothetical protein B0H14DRAFT_2651896 [Mycena olivaceomarginata]|nr:hypothetical protein B0H14DRAFT_2651896 [Mycena olivaceomarginata]